MLTEKLNDLFSQQLSGWELAKTNYEQLKNVKTKRIGFGDFDILVQFNPERIRSSGAKVDSLSISERPCFLCRKNRPPEQMDLAFDGNYTILVNPYPIFSRHLTITSNEHTDQRIADSFADLLRLAASLEGYSVFYNGPQCGASAPDHLHFQAGERGFMPLEKDLHDVRNSKLIKGAKEFSVAVSYNYLRGIVTLRSNDNERIISFFKRFYEAIASVQRERPEPMLNIIAYSEKKETFVHIIPRKQHRPSQFFADENDRIMVSPASVDLGGVIITPREKDFERLGEDTIRDMFSQVCFDEIELAGMVKSVL